jgi:hypothetical protein
MQSKGSPAANFEVCYSRSFKMEIVVEHPTLP